MIQHHKPSMHIICRLHLAPLMAAGIGHMSKCRINLTWVNSGVHIMDNRCSCVNASDCFSLFFFIVWDISLKTENFQLMVAFIQCIKSHSVANLNVCTLLWQFIQKLLDIFMSETKLWAKIRVTVQSRAMLQAWLKMIKAYIMLYICHVWYSDMSSSVSESIHLKRVEGCF